jgi:hypothetical protein
LLGHSGFERGFLARACFVEHAFGRELIGSSVFAPAAAVSGALLEVGATSIHRSLTRCWSSRSPRRASGDVVA